MEAKLKFSQLANIMACIKQSYKNIGGEIPENFIETFQEIMESNDYIFFLLDKTTYENLQHISNE